MRNIIEDRGGSQEPVWWGRRDTTRGTIQERIRRRQAKPRTRVVGRKGHHTGDKEGIRRRQAKPRIRVVGGRETTWERRKETNQE